MFDKLKNRSIARDLGTLAGLAVHHATTATPKVKEYARTQRDVASLAYRQARK